MISPIQARLDKNLPGLFPWFQTPQRAQWFHFCLDLVAQNDGMNTEYFGYDGLGSVRQMLDSLGNLVFAQVVETII